MSMSGRSRDRRRGLCRSALYGTMPRLVVLSTAQSRARSAQERRAYSAEQQGRTLSAEGRVYGTAKRQPWWLWLWFWLRLRRSYGGLWYWYGGDRPGQRLRNGEGTSAKTAEVGEGAQRESEQANETSRKQWCEGTRRRDEQRPKTSQGRKVRVTIASVRCPSVSVEAQSVPGASGRPHWGSEASGPPSPGDVDASHGLRVRATKTASSSSALDCCRVNPALPSHDQTLVHLGVGDGHLRCCIRTYGWRGSSHTEVSIYWRVLAQQ